MVGMGLAVLLLPVRVTDEFSTEIRNGSCDQHEHRLDSIRARLGDESRQHGTSDATFVLRQTHQQRCR